MHFWVAGRSRGGQARAEQLGHEGYVEMGKKGGSATSDMSGRRQQQVLAGKLMRASSPIRRCTLVSGWVLG